MSFLNFLQVEPAPQHCVYQCLVIFQAIDFITGNQCKEAGAARSSAFWQDLEPNFFVLTFSDYCV